MISISNRRYWLDEQAEVSGDNPAIISKDVSLSYKELSEKVNNVYSFLKEIGTIGKDHAAILSENNLDFIVLVLALWRLNAVPVPLNIRLSLNEINSQVEFSDSKFVLVRKNLSSAFNGTKNPIEFPFERETVPAERHFSPSFDLTNDALIMFTSGSSGKPKAVVHTFESLFHSVEATDSLINLNSNDRFLASLPLYHIGGFLIFVRTLLTGSTVVIPESLSSDKIYETMNEFDVNYISIVGKTLKSFLDEKLAPPKSLKYIFLGGGPVDKNLTIEAIKNGWQIIKVYGSTETCSMTAAILPEEILRKPSSSGKPLLNNQIMIEKVSPDSEEGEIAIKSKSLFKECYKSEKEFSKTGFKNGYFLTGDIGHLDDDGYLYVHSKREDLIITGGENVNPGEIKNAIENYDRVEEAYVFGVSDKEWGQIICATIVPKQNIKITEDEIKVFLKKSLAGYKIPKRFLFVEELPKTELGKVLKDKLKEMI